MAEILFYVDSAGLLLWRPCDIGKGLDIMIVVTVFLEISHSHRLSRHFYNICEESYVGIC